MVTVLRIYVYGISQGLILAKAVVDIGREDFATGLAFVAFSRVRTVEDLGIAQDFLPERLRDTKAIEARIEEEMRLAVLADAT